MSRWYADISSNQFSSLERSTRRALYWEEKERGRSRVKGWIQKGREGKGAPSVGEAIHQSVAMPVMMEPTDCTAFPGGVLMIMYTCSPLFLNGKRSRFVYLGHIHLVDKYSCLPLVDNDQFMRDNESIDQPPNNLLVSVLRPMLYMICVTDFSKVA